MRTHGRGATRPEPVSSGTRSRRLPPNGSTVRRRRHWNRWPASRRKASRPKASRSTTTGQLVGRASVARSPAGRSRSVDSRAARSPSMRRVADNPAGHNPAADSQVPGSRPVGTQMSPATAATSTSVLRLGGSARPARRSPTRPRRCRTGRPPAPIVPRHASRRARHPGRRPCSRPARRHWKQVDSPPPPDERRVGAKLIVGPIGRPYVIDDLRWAHQVEEGHEPRAHRPPRRVPKRVGARLRGRLGHQRHPHDERHACGNEGQQVEHLGRLHEFVAATRRLETDRIDVDESLVDDRQSAIERDDLDDVVDDNDAEQRDGGDRPPSNPLHLFPESRLVARRPASTMTLITSTVGARA